MRNGKHAIAGVDPLCQTPQFPHRRATAARIALILNIIVDQREIVDQLDRCRQRQGIARVAANRATAQQAEARAQQFAWIERRRTQFFVAPAEVILLHRIEARHPFIRQRKRRTHRRLDRRSLI